MVKLVKKVKEAYFNKEFILFIIIGGVNTLAGTGFSWMYSQMLNSIAAFVAGYVTATLVAYTLNSTFTFKKKWQFKDLIKYAMSCIPNFLIQFAVVYITVSILGLYKLWGYLLAAIIGVPVTFIILKGFVFKK